MLYLIQVVVLRSTGLFGSPDRCLQIVICPANRLPVRHLLSILMHKRQVFPLAGRLLGRAVDWENLRVHHCKMRIRTSVCLYPTRGSGCCLIHRRGCTTWGVYVTSRIIISPSRPRAQARNTGIRARRWRKDGHADERRIAGARGCHYCTGVCMENASAGCDGGTETLSALAVGSVKY